MNKQEVLTQVLAHIQGDRAEYNPNHLYSSLIGLSLRVLMGRGIRIDTPLDLLFQLGSLRSPHAWINAQLNKAGFDDAEIKEMLQPMSYDLAVYYLKGKVYGEVYGWSEYDCCESSEVFALEVD